MGRGIGAAEVLTIPVLATGGVAAPQGHDQESLRLGRRRAVGVPRPLKRPPFGFKTSWRGIQVTCHSLEERNERTT
ncbi:hypothetical protein AB0K60_35850 [Thermopolyspora sp. NPDC052614]|uniref:hypothetical protein n=1 Tax=Thermopolyspora sp. NPDC052614 TaxID=3155682 RepID=UPI00343C5EAF